MILQNFVPHQRYYGAEPAEIADRGRARVLAHRASTGDAPARGRRAGARARAAAARVGAARSASRTSAPDRARRDGCCPTSASRCPPNLSDWWPELVAAGATDLGGLSANGDHISPEHPFPSPHQVRKRLQADGVALTERLCVYPQYIDPEWIAQGVLDTIKLRYWSLHPAPRPRPARASGPIRRDLVAGAIAKGRDGRGAERARS